MSGLMPEARRGGLESHLGNERCKFGPFTFGGGRNFPFVESTEAGAAAAAAAAATAGGGYAKKSQRQYMQGKRRDRIGGSTTHMDGESDVLARSELSGRGGENMVLAGVSIGSAQQEVEADGGR